MNKKPPAKREPADRAAEQSALGSELALAEERERRRIARGLHDQVGQVLGVAKIKLGQALAAGPRAGVSEPLAEARRLVEQAIREIRSLTFDLSSLEVHDLGLAPALEGLAERARERHGLPFRFETDARSTQMTEEDAALVYSIVRELMWNVVKHAHARQGALALDHREDRLRITVSDDGVGFDAAGAGESPTAGGSLGLLSARQRLEHLGGGLEIDSAPGAGTRVTLTVPLGANGSGGRHAEPGRGAPEARR